MPETTTDTRSTALRPFTVEFGYQNEIHDIRVQTLNEDMRGAFSLAKAGLHGVSEGASALPEMPGVYMEVVPSKNRVRIHDPLLLPEYDGRLDTFNAVRSRVPSIGGSTPFGPIKERVLQFGPNKLKTLCDELLYLVNAGHARLVGGQLPTVEQVKAMPGGFINDPWNNHASKPKLREASLSDVQVEDM